MALNLEKQLLFVSIADFECIINNIDVLKYGSYHHNRVSSTIKIQHVENNLRDEGEHLYPLDLCSSDFNDLFSLRKRSLNIETLNMY